MANPQKKTKQDLSMSLQALESDRRAPLNPGVSRLLMQLWEDGEAAKAKLAELEAEVAALKSRP